MPALLGVSAKAAAHERGVQGTQKGAAATESPQADRYSRGSPIGGHGRLPEGVGADAQISTRRLRDAWRGQLTGHGHGSGSVCGGHCCDFLMQEGCLLCWHQ